MRAYSTRNGVTRTVFWSVVETAVGQIDGAGESIVGYSDKTSVGSSVAATILLVGIAVGVRVSAPLVGSKVVGRMLRSVGRVVVVSGVVVGILVVATILLVGRLVGVVDVDGIVEASTDGDRVLFAAVGASVSVVGA